MFPTSTPEPVRAFFASVSSPAEILSSKLVPRVEGTDVIKGGYNFIHILNVDIDPHCRWLHAVLSTSPGSQHTTPTIYAYGCTHGSEFMGMEYIDGDALSNVWLDISEIMHSMRTKTSFRMIGGIAPDGSTCPLFDGMDGRADEVLVDSFGLYNTGPYKSMREYLQAILDRRYHYLDQMLHKGTLPVKFKEEMARCLSYSSPEDIFERVNLLRDEFKANPYDCKYPFVLRHGDLHRRNVIVSRSSPRRILGIIDWDFGGSHAPPFADSKFELAYPESDQDTNKHIQQAEELQDSEFLLSRVVGEPCPLDANLTYWMTSTRFYVLDFEATTTSGKSVVSSVC